MRFTTQTNSMLSIPSSSARARKPTASNSGPNNTKVTTRDGSNPITGCNSVCDNPCFINGLCPTNTCLQDCERYCLDVFDPSNSAVIQVGPNSQCASVCENTCFNSGLCPTQTCLQDCERNCLNVFDASNSA
ncbi:hypothetical protein BGW80DRAFT_1307990 [Lactifluus volemus]|nr:hypothetical protein BGW80DRAFT_1307990 [Lactifluus volemus]